MIDDFGQIRCITILGVGLIGGSLGLALKAKGFQGKIVGLGRRTHTLKIALERGAVDSVTTEFGAGLRNAELVVVGTPVHLIPTFVQRIADVRSADAKPLLITDVGSVKQRIVEKIEALLSAPEYGSLRFVGAHPMAGSEKTSAAAGRANLYEGAKCIVTQTDNTPPEALEVVEDLWRFVGARVFRLSPTEHDTLIAGASHLPHLIASVLTATVGEIGTDSATALDFAATGFRDSTRIAAAAPDLWTDIFLQNASPLIPMIDTVIENLAAFSALLKNQDHDRIEAILTSAKNLRETVEVRCKNG